MSRSRKPRHPRRPVEDPIASDPATPYDADEMSTGQVRAAAVVEIMDEFRDAQRTVLRLASFIKRRQADIDDEREAMFARVRREFPDVEDETIMAIVNGMESVNEQLDQTPRPLPDASFEPLERKIGEAIAAIVAELPEDYQTPEFLEQVERAQKQEPSAPVLLESLLVNLVGSFELLIGAIARFMISEHPTVLKSSEREFTWNDVASHGTLEAFRESVIDRAVDDLLRGSAATWVKFFTSKFGIDSPKLADDYSFREVLQRRHVIVHNGARVSRLYLENLEGMPNPPALNDRLSVDFAYLTKAADTLAVVALELTGKVGRKVCKSDGSMELNVYLANLPYRFLQDRRYQVTLDLTRSFPPESFDRDYAGMVTRVNRWLALKRLGRFAECRAEVEDWQTAALNPIFRLARLALLDEMEAGLALLRRIRGTPELTNSFYITWPLLAELRDHERAQKLSQEPTADPENEGSE